MVFPQKREREMIEKKREMVEKKREMVEKQREMVEKHQVALFGPWGVRACFSALLAIFTAFIVISAVSFLMQNGSDQSEEDSSASSVDVFGSFEGNTTGSNELCDLFSGKWVYDDDSIHPLYSGLGCSFVHEELACDKFGRKDRKFQSWRWQPHGCDLPRFNATKLLERLRGKRMVYVGDSLNRNQWVSMVCLLESSIPTSHKSLQYNGSLLSFKAKEFNASIDFYWAPLLLESNCDDPVIHRMSERMMRNGSMEWHARNWADAEILIFNSYLWWKKPGMKMKILYGSSSFEDKNRTYEEVEMINGFELALKTWSDWLESHVDTHTKQLFFVSLSPTHVWGQDWGMASNQNCYNETEPITRVGYMGRGSDPAMMKIAEREIEGLRNKGVNIQFLNITQLSEYRKDGHPSIYRKFWDRLSEQQLANPSSYSDCTHWCLPGVPDVWNEILYAFIFSKDKDK